MGSFGCFDILTDVFGMHSDAERSPLGAQAEPNEGSGRLHDGEGLQRSGRRLPARGPLGTECSAQALTLLREDFAVHAPRMRRRS